MSLTCYYFAEEPKLVFVFIGQSTFDMSGLMLARTTAPILNAEWELFAGLRCLCFIELFLRLCLVWVCPYCRFNKRILLI